MRTRSRSSPSSKHEVSSSATSSSTSGSQYFSTATDFTPSHDPGEDTESNGDHFHCPFKGFDDCRDGVNGRGMGTSSRVTTDVALQFMHEYACLEKTMSSFKPSWNNCLRTIQWTMR
ncbi:hypothetical protein C5167_022600 [Papaver somniferum]|uniref:Uncharacterized protein n=1 Tax=Papaver somniferum TaxID=3469 RepID=A0A4Y7JLZ6_PAPSO|nr:hypothetical protein C5167_022600 [Papaver somniferum]